MDREMYRKEKKGVFQFEEDGVCGGRSRMSTEEKGQLGVFCISLRKQAFAPVYDSHLFSGKI